MFKQKLDYSHSNPVVASLYQFPEEYRYSSASFYETGKSELSFITRYQALKIVGEEHPTKAKIESLVDFDNPTSKF